MAACPHCGAEIRADARFCRHCGSSDEDGWREDLQADVDDFDYDDYVAENFSTRREGSGAAALWRGVAIALLILFALSCLMF